MISSTRVRLIIPRLARSLKGSSNQLATDSKKPTLSWSPNHGCEETTIDSKSMLGKMVEEKLRPLKISRYNARLMEMRDAKSNYDRVVLYSYLMVCVDCGQLQRANNMLVSCMRRKSTKPSLDVSHFNLVISGWSKHGMVNNVTKLRNQMRRLDIKPNGETYAHSLYACANGAKRPSRETRRLLDEMKSHGIDPTHIFREGYLNPAERSSIKSCLVRFIPDYEDRFVDVSLEYNCKLARRVYQIKPELYDFAQGVDMWQANSSLLTQMNTETKSTIDVKSVMKSSQSESKTRLYKAAWQEHVDMWRKSITSTLNETLQELSTQNEADSKVHIYPYLCSVDKNYLVELMLDEIENKISMTRHSPSTRHLHSQFGAVVMTKYLRAKTIANGSHDEKMLVYRDYVDQYLSNPKLMGSMNSREFIQNRAIETKNYAVHKDSMTSVEHWPYEIVIAVGRLLYRIIVKEIQFDPAKARYPMKKINQENLINVFYTAYFQVEGGSHKIKEELRAHEEAERFYQKACNNRLKFDYTQLPMTCPPMPWLSPTLGGYITTPTDLIRSTVPNAVLFRTYSEEFKNQNLYPSIDSLTALGLCPWIVNKEILKIVIQLFCAGGDYNLKVPLHESKMGSSMPVIKEGSTKAEKIIAARETRRQEQKINEMYSLWRDCLYRLSIANHFRNQVIWFPHNMDFRGRTYPLAPHFNHLGADLARSLLLFAKGRPLGDRGLEWLKLHVINLTGLKKRFSIEDRIEFANSILHSEILDSADNPWDGRRWWTKHENPWQVLACCKEISRAIRSRDHREYVSHFPIHQDGSCNGLQHYAALGRDEEGARAVNLVPDKVPQDVYSRVVELVEEARKLDSVEGNKTAQLLEGFVQRKVVKQTVMTVVYGVTRYGARQQIARQLHNKNYKDNQVWQASKYLTHKTFESIGQMFNKSRLIQDWFNECAHLIAGQLREPVRWHTPLGFFVSQPYTVAPNIASRLYSSQIINEFPMKGFNNTKLNTIKQRNAFPPNYVHSLDSSHMMLTSLFCQREGLTFVSVHDCYWTHPATVEDMNRICREQFVALHSEPLLQDLADQFKARYLSGCNEGNAKSADLNPLHKIPEQGTLDLRVVLESPYFFS